MPIALLRSASKRVLASAQSVRFAHNATALTVSKFGNWSNVLEAKQQEVADPKDGEVLVKFQAAPINPADFDVIAGVYGKLPSTPAVAGNEGVGVIEAVGSGVNGLKKGQRVIPATPGAGTWRTMGVLSANDVIPVADDIPLEYAATLSVNPCTAYRLLQDFADLKSGDVVVQNGANSAVGQAVIQMCAARGIKTVNIVRSRMHLADVQEYLKNIGGTVVVPQEHIDRVGIKAVTEGLPAAKLALNCVGGQSSLDAARMLGNGGVHVTYGGMSRQAVTLPTGPMVFNDIQARGFWMTRWVENASREERVQMMNDISQMVRDGKYKLLIERIPFADWKQGLELAQAPGNTRKVVLTM